jgi:hypothetical protein
MSESKLSTRRRFVSSAGAALSVPLVAGTVGADLAAGAQAPAVEPALARREAISAVRDLTHTLAFSVGAADSARIERLFVDPLWAAELAGIRWLTPSGLAPDTYELSADCTTARFEMPVAVEVEAPLVADGTLAQMAQAQGTGFVRRRESRLLSAECVRGAAGWQFLSLYLRRAGQRA